MTKDEALKKIATVNAMDYEYKAWARQALANDALKKKADNARELGLDYEPMTTDESDEFDRIERENSMKGQPYVYEQKRPWVELTNHEIYTIHKALGGYTADNWDYERAIEAKLKELNS